jgi:ubiquinone/menaquinone biosynthesis C-methylase UbiE
VSVPTGTRQEPSLAARIERERHHAVRAIASDESRRGFDSPAGRIREERRLTFLCASGAETPDLRVLELGCGSGTFSGELARVFPGLIATDVSETLLNVARKRVPNVEFRCEDAHRTRFADSSFDLVLGCSVLHHLVWAVAIEEIRRILKPGGELRFSEPNLLNPQIYLQKNWKWLKKRMGDSPDEYAFTPGQISRDLVAAGFDDVVAEPYEFLHPAVPASLIRSVIALERFLERTALRQFGGSIRIRARRPSHGKRSSGGQTEI